MIRQKVLFLTVGNGAFGWVLLQHSGKLHSPALHGHVGGSELGFGLLLEGGNIFVLS